MRAVLYSILALFAFVAPAAAEEPAYPLENAEVMVDVNGDTARLLACFEQVTMPAKVLVEHERVAPERRQYVKRRNGTIELVEYPARYRQIRTVLEPGYVELRQIPCKKKRFSLFGF